MRQLAEKDAKNVWRERGEKMSDMPKGWLSKATQALLDKNDGHYRTKAEKMVREANKAKGDVDISAITF
jgi:hypothetical protein